MDRVAVQLGLQRLGRALRDDAAAVDDRQPAREPVGLLEVVGGQQDGDAILAREADDLVPQLGARVGVEPGRRLVEEQHARPVDEAHRHVELPAHAAGPRPDDAVGRLGEAQPIQERLGARPQLAIVEGEQPALEAEILAARRRRVDRAALPDDPDRAPDPVRVAEHVVARDVAVPPVGRESVERILTVVDLPAPFGPSSPKIVPGATDRLTPSRARMSPGYTLTRSRASIPSGGEVSCGRIMCSPKSLRC